MSGEKISLIRLYYSISTKSQKIRKKILNSAGFLTTCIFATNNKYQLPYAYVQSLKCLEAWGIVFKDLI